MKVKLLNIKCVPVRGSEHSAGFDLKVSKAVTIEPGETKKVTTGIQVEIPEGYVGLVFPRSGLGTDERYKMRLANTVGVIDSDYRGEVKAFIENRGDEKLLLKAYERFCQLVVVPYLNEPVSIVDRLSDTDRGDNGFGSTGR